MRLTTRFRYSYALRYPLLSWSLLLRILQYNPTHRYPSVMRRRQRKSLETRVLTITSKRIGFVRFTHIIALAVMLYLYCLCCELRTMKYYVPRQKRNPLLTAESIIQTVLSRASELRVICRIILCYICASFIDKWATVGVQVWKFIYTKMTYR